MTSQLQRARREAGYHCARELADELNIAASTYSRWERKPDTIPTASAVMLADKLNVSVDVVLGRKPCEGQVHDLAERIKALPALERGMLDDYLGYLESRAKR